LAGDKTGEKTAPGEEAGMAAASPPRVMRIRLYNPVERIFLRSTSLSRRTAGSAGTLALRAPETGRRWFHRQERRALPDFY